MSIRKPLFIKLPPELIDEVDAWREKQVVSPNRTAVIEQAIRQFLEREREAERHAEAVK